MWTHFEILNAIAIFFRITFLRSYKFEVVKATAARIAVKYCILKNLLHGQLTGT
jgi:hypothetical protein